MKIIVVGVGKVGYTLAEQLVREGHDVTVIDNDETVLRQTGDDLDVMVLKGNGAAVTPLRAAGVGTADLTIAATSSDEINMVCALTAKRLGSKMTIARIRSVDYTAELDVLKNELGVDLVINPELTTAREIFRLLRFPNAVKIETFHNNRVELMGFRLKEDDFLCGQPLMATGAKLKSVSVLMCAVDRDGDVVIPNGAFVPKAGDMVYMIGSPMGLNKFFKVLGRYIPKINKVMIVGGGRLTHYLSEYLIKAGVQVKIIEKNEALSRHVSEMLPKATVIHGDGTNQQLLEMENIKKTDAFVTLTDRDEENLLAALYAKHCNVPKVIAKANQDSYRDIARSIGMDALISPKYVTAAQILQMVRGMMNSQGSVMDALYKIADNKAEALEFRVTPGTRNVGIPLKDVRLKKGILVAIVLRDRDIIIPEGSTTIELGDSVILVTTSSAHTIMDINDIFEMEDAPKEVHI